MLAQISHLSSDPAHDVHVDSYELLDRPARVKFNITVGTLRFFSEITYHSIQDWECIWNKYTPALRNRLIGLIAAWDAMRFMALGGQRLHLCDGLECDETVQTVWTRCFRSQFGEWRYRNQIAYPDDSFPQLVSRSSSTSPPISTTRPAPRWLLTNGGGKDTLASLMMLSSLDTPFDFYEACLPIGGTHDRQDELLCQLRSTAAAENVEVRKVSIHDNFADRDDGEIVRAGIKAQHYKTDFAVGHTSNYVGYFPVILHHGYTQLWFNIEKSADDAMVVWNGEPINHQWCKSAEYHQISLALFKSICGQDWFEGFSSPLHGLYDTTIYKIVSLRPELLQMTHSCNYGKPWCAKCTKCLFCYMMMSAYVDEPFAQRVLGVHNSLFAEPELGPIWEELLSPKKVAWECVPSHEECQLAARICVSKGLEYPILLAYATPMAAVGQLWARFSSVEWGRVPPILVAPLRKLLNMSSIPLVLDAMVVGAGQAGLSASYLLQKQNSSHVVLEAGKIAQAWRSRWDSFQLNTPNKYTHLAGMAYDGDNPDGFAGKDEVVDFMVRYAAKFSLPVMEDCPVTEARRDGLYFKVSTPEGTWRVRTLIVASGHYARPYFPPAAENLPATMHVLHSSKYRSAAALPAGPVLVIGGGQSGAQISEDLNDAGRKVYWSISERPCNYRRYRGEDFMHWWEVGGVQHRAIEDHPSIIAGEPDAKRKLRRADFPLVSGKGAGGLGHSITYKSLWASGITLLGRFDAASERHVHFRPDVQAKVSAANRMTLQIREELDRIATEFGAVPAKMPLDSLSGVDVDWVPPDTTTELSLVDGRISSIIFATGFAHGWPWLHIPNIADEMGYPMGDHGIHPIPGLYFLGLFNQQRLSSICLCNGGRDSQPIAEDIISYLQEWKRIGLDVSAQALPSDPTKRKVLVVGGSAQAKPKLESLVSCDMQLHFFEPLLEAGDDDILASIRQHVIYARLTGIDAVFSLGGSYDVISAAVAKELNIPGPSPECVLISRHQTDRAGLSQQEARAYQRYVDTVRTPLESSDTKVSHVRLSPDDIRVVGWSDSAGSAHGWSVAPGPLDRRSAALALAQEYAESRGIRSSFWTTQVNHSEGKAQVSALSVGLQDAQELEELHMIRAALALCAGYEAETRTLADATLAESMLSPIGPVLSVLGIENVPQ